MTEKELRALADEFGLEIDDVRAAAGQAGRIEILMRDDGLTRNAAIISIAMEDSWLPE